MAPYITNFGVLKVKLMCDCGTKLTTSRHATKISCYDCEAEIFVGDLIKEYLHQRKLAEDEKQVKRQVLIQDEIEGVVRKRDGRRTDPNRLVQMRELLEKGITKKELAEQFKISEVRVYQIIRQSNLPKPIEVVKEKKPRNPDTWSAGPMTEEEKAEVSRRVENTKRHFLQKYPDLLRLTSKIQKREW